MLLRLWIIALLIFPVASSHGAFWNLTQTEKNALAECVLYLYLHENNITCLDEKKAVTEEVYKQFLESAQKNLGSEFAPRVQAHPSHAFENFDQFKKSIMEVCKKGPKACHYIYNKTQNTSKFQRKECNKYCSAKTCKDVFTLASCYALSAYTVEGKRKAEGQSPICPLNTVRNCLKNRDASLKNMIDDRGWPRDWVDIKKNWGNLFFLTATEPAKGRHLGIRAAQAGTVLAVLAAMPFVIHAIWPALPMLTVTWPKALAWGKSFLSGQIQNIKLTASSDVTQSVIQDVSTVAADA
jgi:hypothetical protein